MRHLAAPPVTALVSLLFVLLAGLPAPATGQELIDFELEDQFGTIHRRADVAGSIVLLIGSDKGGSRFNGSWGKAIREALGDHPGYPEISQLAHADLSGVPFFLKGMIRKKFPEDPERWVLMDWKGAIARAYDFAARSSNVLVFAPDGLLVHHTVGREPDEDGVEEVVAILRDLLDE